MHLSHFRCPQKCQTNVFLLYCVFQLYSLNEYKPPISKAKMTQITKSAIKAIKVSICCKCRKGKLSQCASLTACTQRLHRASSYMWHHSRGGEDPPHCIAPFKGTCSLLPNSCIHIFIHITNTFLQKQFISAFLFCIRNWRRQNLCK